VVVTHEPDIARRCQRCIRIHDGKVSANGPAAEVAAAYAQAQAQA
jgi:ABC-type polysaccharide/polyol phosphate transport system ATPase subunit